MTQAGQCRSMERNKNEGASMDDLDRRIISAWRAADPEMKRTILKILRSPEKCQARRQSRLSSQEKPVERDE